MLGGEVASFTDAWIETTINCLIWDAGLSHLLQMRGLKLCSNGALLASTVASFTDAWIETTVATRTAAILKSHLLQMRGLKHFYWFRVRASIGRIFYRCVDWNKVLLMRRLLPRVASFTDAWIETYFRRREQYLKSRIFYRCVDWNRAYEAIYNAYIRSHLLQMRGLKLWRGEHSNGYYVSHLLQMRGLKLLLTLKLSLIGLSHLLQMRGLKQQDQKYDDAQRMSHLLQMRGLKHEVANVTLAL